MSRDDPPASAIRRGRPPGSHWDHARVAALCTLLAASKTFDEVGQALNISRNAVAGQVNRMKQRGDARLPTIRRGRKSGGRHRTASERYGHGGALRRFASIKPNGHHVHLAPDHPALVEGRTLFPSRVEDPDQRPRLLIDGHNSRKIGRRVTKGRWKDFPIFTLTLEERATCPRSCLEWATCYGNGSNWARRIRHGRALEERLWDELAVKQAMHPAGFVVRLHVLGDFYSEDYAEFWAEALEAYPALHVFGYTAHPPASPIGTIIAELLGLHPDRWRMRFSGHDGPTDGAVVVDRAEDTGHLVCPAQLDDSGRRCCANCSLCWATDRTIAFLRH